MGTRVYLLQFKLCYETTFGVHTGNAPKPCSSDAGTEDEHFVFTIIFRKPINSFPHKYNTSTTIQKHRR